MTVTTLSRLSLLALVVGVLLGEIVLASIGLAGLCGAAVYLSVQQDSQIAARRDDGPSDPQFLA
ncbi:MULTISPECIES: hypothetical protein [Pseudomonas]|uniref:hypothetical protein n=1 Tax=Pseudomonas TaxID=286 RepID=UPI001F028475|nr:MULTISPECIES: hypothetical protein [Pseudomonas]MCG8291241.1 hypothetical protein [Pseudomonas entomophila]